MNLEELYQWTGRLRKIFKELGHWQLVGLALYSYGVVVTRGCAARKVAEGLGVVGKSVVCSDG